MARPWRIQFPHATYHVMARGNNRRDVFIDDPGRMHFLGLLADATARFNLQVLAFCLMPSHYHLFLRTPDANLSAGMHWINAVYTQRFNRRQRSVGHLFQGRFKAVLVADDSHWFHLSAYIHLNPVRVGLAADPAEYEWSSFRDYTRARGRFPWLHSGAVLAAYGDNDAAQRRNYRRQVLALAGRKPSFWEEVRQAAFLGTDEQWDELRRTHPPAGQAREVSDYRNPSRPRVNPGHELQRVAALLDAKPEDLTHCRHPARPLAYLHLTEHCGLSITRVADLMGVNPSTVSHGVIRLKSSLAADPAGAARIEWLKSQVKT